ncbi:MAG: hypothetical protein A2W61_01840 [Deltaproteobacteria bacterium RIFCSPLOWO2_01_44_7]|nr:MAG: hypothetical protein A2712_03320 [Deltaproteobacteria bacterium RIFCSPHIGHO2_01_FULL_43_49]OGQ16224.1 MAG: hypothetical protein A3D22_01290 [Deltaproteobacteria bacterium RIFCSPHIGHO2_02_FULL_44_53]OGQ29184.1 MAG: hypothetical protein A3D98_05075 [Deltaproteobacteria bacterium RIFCSPHIGHO2_12_FULL_44_21]OGQ32741.1 MAG: hypothetical protein A2979_09220 [Deltaproteobacteria bacterium RIFCSPLOWO2_01_FULL_45_74]OGQ39946.1 MAG: hypothetical protein A2W61_01840 [Deltaproteobacteria bacterium 
MKKEGGFTLVEIVLTIALVSILFASAGLILRQGLDSYAHISERSANLQAARYAMERMSRELELVGDESSTNIQSIQSNSVSFVDSDSITTDFNFTNQALYRGTDLLLSNVTSATFTGFKDNGNTTSSGQQTRRVRIEFSTLPPGQTAPLTLRTDVFIRNYLYENFQ